MVLICNELQQSNENPPTQMTIGTACANTNIIIRLRHFFNFNKYEEVINKLQISKMKTIT